MEWMNELQYICMMEYCTAAKIIELQLYTTTQNILNGQISSILFKEINFKGMMTLKIRTVVTLRGGAHRGLQRDHLS